ncbi:repulsive guidance molecule A-like [Argopecten irradians]|uniref:repulsive guidance molecule A-like n=1 Tax=Argopecten irradians TaxID=31199 RepID=UPI0037204705
MKPYRRQCTPLRAERTCTRNGEGFHRDFALPSTLWKGMGTRCLSYPPMPPISALVLLLLVGIGVDSAIGCDLGMCWTRYQDATAALNSGILEDLMPAGIKDNPKCVVIRTYVKCLNKQGHRSECKTSLTFQSEKIGYKKTLKELNCSINGEVYDPSAHTVPHFPQVPDSEFMCSYEGPRNYKHCGLFGDPHLRTFSDEFQTCKVEGAWSLINNKHLTVQVTNDPVVTSGAATATSKLTVVIKKNEDCAAHRFVTYAAQTDHLPGSFDDGSTTYGQDNSVRLYEIEPGKHIKIYLRFIDTTIVVRQIGRYFTFAIKMPQDVINKSREEDVLELCVRGCPQQERINYQKYLAEKKNKILPPTGVSSDSIEMQRSDAVRLCKQAKVVDFYFDSCVFDLMTTGDKVFTVSAYQAWQDLIELTPEMRQTQTNRTDLSRYDNMHSSAATYRTNYTSSFRILILTILVCLWHQCQVV